MLEDILTGLAYLTQAELKVVEYAVKARQMPEDKFNQWVEKITDRLNEN